MTYLLSQLHLSCKKPIEHSDVSIYFAEDVNLIKKSQLLTAFSSSAINRVKKLD